MVSNAPWPCRHFMALLSATVLSVSYRCLMAWPFGSDLPNAILWAVCVDEEGLDRGISPHAHPQSGLNRATTSGGQNVNTDLQRKKSETATAGRPLQIHIYALPESSP